MKIVFLLSYGMSIVLWVAFAISSIWTTLRMFKSPDTEYLNHYGLLFHYIVVALLTARVIGIVGLQHCAWLQDR